MSDGAKAFWGRISMFLFYVVLLYLFLHSIGGVTDSLMQSMATQGAGVTAIERAGDILAVLLKAVGVAVVGAIVVVVSFVTSRESYSAELAYFSSCINLVGYLISLKVLWDAVNNPYVRLAIVLVGAGAVGASVVSSKS